MSSIKYSIKNVVYKKSQAEKLRNLWGNSNLLAVLEKFGGWRIVVAILRCKASGNSSL